MALWHAKKDQNQDQVTIEVPDTPQAAGGDQPGQLQELTERLDQLGQLLGKANEQVAAYLMRRESQAAAGDADDDADGALSEKIDSLAERLDRLAAGGPARDPSAAEPAAKAADEEELRAALHPMQEKLDQVDAKLKSLVDKAAGAGSEDAPGPTLLQVRDAVNQQLGALADGIRQLQQRLDAGLQEVADLLRPQQPEEPASGPATSSEWQRIIFGAELAEHPGLDFQRQQLLNGLMGGDAGACSLVGQLLVFRSAMTDKMPPLLKEIGEAYYRWQPKTRPGSNKMEELLVEWLKETCEDAGIPNTIELVHPGERFDSTRHSATTRGVEIAEVRGWVVLRDNGKVYSKASVAVK